MSGGGDCCPSMQPPPALLMCHGDVLGSVVDMQVVGGIHTFMVVLSASPQTLSSEGHLSSPGWVTVVALVCVHH